MTVARAVLAGLLIAAVAAPASVLAQEVVGDRAVYSAEYFAPFAPRTALDMVRRTPGFVLDEGDTALRGFGAAAGNVLVDGARPSSKTGPVDALSRISAAQVERIELIRGGVNSEAQGRSLVVNVVTRSGGASGAWSVEVERNGNGVVYPRADLSRSQTLGEWRTSLRLNTYWEEFPFRTLVLSRDPSGVLISSASTDRPSTLGEANLSAEAQREMSGGQLRMNARVGWYNYYFDQPGQLFLARLPDGVPDQLQLTQLDVERRVFEGGADYTRTAGDWTWKTLGVINYRDGAESSRDRRDTPRGVLISASQVESTARPLEVVARTTVSAANGPWRPDFGIEVAFNRFDRTFALTIDNGAGPAPAPIPAANVRVEELRGEAFANLVWTASPRWSVEAGLAVEMSQISVEGDAEASQDFAFLKPSLVAVWRPRDRLELRAGVRRTVGQLDFSDFAAGSSLDDGTTSAGNPDLGPDQTTRWFAAVDWRGAGDLAVNLELFHEQRQDVIEQVLLPSGAPGLANVGDATYRGLKGSITLPLDHWLAGARLTAKAEIVDSAFNDPLIGRDRPLSYVYSPDAEVEFRHDPPGRPVSWGVTWTAASSGEVYLIDEIDALDSFEVFSGFVETTALGPFKTRLGIRNAAPSRSYRFRRFFDPDRSGQFTGTEERHRRAPMFVTLTLSSSF